LKVTIFRGVVYRARTEESKDRISGLGGGYGNGRYHNLEKRQALHWFPHVDAVTVDLASVARFQHAEYRKLERTIIERTKDEGLAVSQTSSDEWQRYAQVKTDYFLSQKVQAVLILAPRTEEHDRDFNTWMDRYGGDQLIVFTARQEMTQALADGPR
jgi:hypothetical protein